MLYTVLDVNVGEGIFLPASYIDTPRSNTENVT